MTSASASDALRLAREQRRTEISRGQLAMLTEIIKSPLFQSLAVWIIVEELQKYQKLGSVSGTILEAGSLMRLWDFSRAIDNLAKISQAVGPLLLAKAAA